MDLLASYWHCQGNFFAFLQKWENMYSVEKTFSLTSKLGPVVQSLISVNPGLTL